MSTKVCRENVELGCILIATMSEKEFKDWLEGKNISPTEFEKASAEYLKVPIEERIADLKQRAALRKGVTSDDSVKTKS